MSIVVASIFSFGLLWEIWCPAILVAIGMGIVVGYIIGAHALVQRLAFRHGLSCRAQR